MKSFRPIFCLGKPTKFTCQREFCFEGIDMASAVHDLIIRSTLVHGPTARATLRIRIIWSDPETALGQTSDSDACLKKWSDPDQNSYFEKRSAPDSGCFFQGYTRIRFCSRGQIIGGFFSSQISIFSPSTAPGYKAVFFTNHHLNCLKN